MTSETVERALVSLANGDRLWVSPSDGHRLEEGSHRFMEVLDYGSPPPCTCCSYRRGSQRRVRVATEHVVSAQRVEVLA